MPILIHDKIRIGVSACNAGARVRWNRAGWDRIAPLNREMTSFVWTPVCPEVMSGLGVPRELKAPAKELSKHKFVEELLAMEKRAVIEGYDFEGAPVLYREIR